MKKVFTFCWLSLFLQLFIPNHTLASRITLHMGPPAVGGGGPNPISIPPTNPVEFELVYLTKNMREITVGFVPGFFYGSRMRLSSLFYSSLGGGVALSYHGIGPGVYSAIGMDMGGSRFFWNVEIKQALSLTPVGLSSPYALRMGVTYAF